MNKCKIFELKSLIFNRFDHFVIDFLTGQSGLPPPAAPMDCSPLACPVCRYLSASVQDMHQHLKTHARTLAHLEELQDVTLLTRDFQLSSM